MDIVTASTLADASESSLGAAILAPAWDVPVQIDAVAHLTETRAAVLSRQAHRALLPGAHVALFTPGATVDIAGLALRLAGFEIRDSVSFVREGQVSYWLIGRKESGGTVIDSTLEYGTGGLNIAACRVGGADTAPDGGESEDGRWPPNVLLDPHAAAEMNRQAPSAGGSGPASGPTLSNGSRSNSMTGSIGPRVRTPFYGDLGGAARFFPCVAGGIGTDWIRSLITPPESACVEMVDEAA